jgi:hypothetical protein
MITNNKKAFHPYGTKGLSVVPPNFFQSQTRKADTGGPEGIRTPDLIHAMDALSQLRYRPMLQISERL